MKPNEIFAVLIGVAALVAVFLVTAFPSEAMKGENRKDNERKAIRILEQRQAVINSLFFLRHPSGECFAVTGHWESMAQSDWGTVTWVPKELCK